VTLLVAALAVCCGSPFADLIMVSSCHCFILAQRSRARSSLPATPTAALQGLASPHRGGSSSRRRVVKAFGPGGPEQEAHAGVEGSSSPGSAPARITAAFSAILDSFPGLHRSACWPLGGWLVMQHQSRSGVFLAFSSYVLAGDPGAVSVERSDDQPAGPAPASAGSSTCSGRPPRCREAGLRYAGSASRPIGAREHVALYNGSSLSWTDVSLRIEPGESVASWRLGLRQVDPRPVLARFYNPTPVWCASTGVTYATHGRGCP